MGYRLSPELQLNLEWYWCEREAEQGVRSSLGGTIAQLERCAPPSPVLVDRAAALTRWREASDEERRRIHEEGWAREDEAIRLGWETQTVNDDSGHLRSDETGESRGYERAQVVRVALTLLVTVPRGRLFEKVLWQIYGNPRQAKVADELAELRAFAPAAAERESLFVDASRSYASAVAEAQAEERAQSKRRRRAQLGALLGRVA